MRQATRTVIASALPSRPRGAMLAVLLTTRCFAGCENDTPSAEPAATTDGAALDANTPATPDADADPGTNDARDGSTPMIDAAVIGANEWKRLGPIKTALPEGYAGRFILFYEGYLGDHLQIGGSIYGNTLWALTPGDATVRFLHLTETWRNDSPDKFVATGPISEPHPRHTYADLTLVSHRRELYQLSGACGKSPECPGPDFWRYDMKTERWSAITAPLPDTIGGYEGTLTSLPGSNQLWAFSPEWWGSGWVNFFMFDITAGTWSARVNYGTRVWKLVHAVADPPRGRFLVWTADGAVHSFDPAKRILTRIADAPTLPPSGAVAYMPKYDRFFFYGAASGIIWIYDPTAGTWTNLPHSGDPLLHIDHYLAYDAVNDVIATRARDGSYWTFRYVP